MHDVNGINLEVFKHILRKYAVGPVPYVLEVLNDKGSALINLFYELNWSGEQHDEYYNSYRAAEAVANEGDFSRVDELKEIFRNKALKYFELAGRNEEYINEHLDGFSRELMILFCYPRLLNLIFEDYFNSERENDNKIVKTNKKNT